MEVPEGYRELKQVWAENSLNVLKGGIPKAGNIVWGQSDCLWDGTVLNWDSGSDNEKGATIRQT